jgi:hypothetical protein
MQELMNTKEYNSKSDFLLEVMVFLSQQNDAKVFFFDNEVQDKVNSLIKKYNEMSK